MSETPERWRQLDGLRAIAVLAVLYTHFLPEKYWLFGYYWGGAGVRLFFVLSGFLITGILLREGKKGQELGIPRSHLIRRFYLRRFLRLTPVFFVTLCVAWMLDIPHTRETFWWHVFYLSNINFALTDSYQWSVGHFWTLAVEEQFYLIWPLVVLFLTRKHLAIIILAIIPLVFLYRWSANATGVPEIAIWVLLPDSLDALLLGAFLALLLRYSDLGTKNWSFNAIATVAFCGGAFLHFFTPPEIIVWIDVQRTLVAIFFGWLVLRAVESHQDNLGRFLQSRPLVYLGRISYGIYVLHPFVKYEVRHSGIFDKSSLVLIALLSTLLTIFFAALSWRFLEKPINEFRSSIGYQSDKKRTHSSDRH